MAITVHSGSSRGRCTHPRYDVDAGNPEELLDKVEPWAALAARRGLHAYFDDSEPRGNQQWSLFGCSGDLRSARGFLVMHGDGAARLADALDKRIIGAHPFPRDLFEAAGLDPVLADPVPVAVVDAVELPPSSATPITIDLERIGKGRRGVALFDQCRWWGYVQSKGAALGCVASARSVLRHRAERAVCCAGHSGAGALDCVVHR